MYFKSRQSDQLLSVNYLALVRSNFNQTKPLYPFVKSQKTDCLANIANDNLKEGYKFDFHAVVGFWNAKCMFFF